MSNGTDAAIDRLVDDLQPVAPLRSPVGFAWTGLAFVLSFAVVLFVFGLRRGLMEGEAQPMFFVTNGVLFVLGLASASSTVTMASPRVGSRHDGIRWALFMTGVLPLVALAVLVGIAPGHFLLFDGHGWMCAAVSLAAAAMIAIPLIVWLRRGAAVNLPRAGLHLGVAAGALGSVAYGMACPDDTMSHLGLWHVLPVAVGGLLGRLAVPRLIAW